MLTWSVYLCYGGMGFFDRELEWGSFLRESLKARFSY